MSAGSNTQSAGRTVFALACRVVVGGLFIFAAWVKLRDPQAFALSITGFKIFPAQAEHLVKYAAFALPWLEMIAGVMVVAGVWTRVAAALLALQLMAFIAAIVSVLERGMVIKCGCFGKFKLFCSDELGWCNVAQNSVLLAMALVLVVLGGGALAVDRLGRKG